MRTRSNFYILMLIITIFLFVVIFFLFQNENPSIISVTTDYIIEKLDKQSIELDIKSQTPIKINIKKGLKNGTKITINNKTNIEHTATIEDESRSNIPIKVSKSLIFIKNNVWEMGYRNLK